MIQTTTEVTRWLNDVAKGDREAEERLVRAIYADLKGLARRELGRWGGNQTLQITALVHEAYLKVLRDGRGSWPNRRFFFRALARAMHLIMIDAHRKWSKRVRRHELDEDVPGAEDLRLLDEVRSLYELLESMDSIRADAAEMFRLHFFLGMTFREIGAELGVPPEVVGRRVEYVRAWLHRRLADAPGA